MLIKVKGDGHNIVIPFPNSLLFNPVTAKIIVASSKKEKRGDTLAPKPPELSGASDIDESTVSSDGEESTVTIEESDDASSGFHIEKSGKNGRSEFHMSFNAFTPKDKNGDFPFTEAQVSTIMRELRRCHKLLDGQPLVEVHSSDGELVEIYL